VAKISRNQRRDVAEQLMLAKMGWHCITVWECDLRPKVREKTLTSLTYTLNRIWLADHTTPQVYRPVEEQEGLMAAEDLTDHAFDTKG
jgi:DNA mismatch endonuclease (patch repair protein)